MFLVFKEGLLLFIVTFLILLFCDLFEFERFVSLFCWFVFVFLVVLANLSICVCCFF